MKLFFLQIVFFLINISSFGQKELFKNKEEIKNYCENYSASFKAHDFNKIKESLCRYYKNECSHIDSVLIGIDKHTHDFSNVNFTTLVDRLKSDGSNMFIWNYSLKFVIHPYIYAYTFTSIFLRQSNGWCISNFSFRGEIKPVLK